MLYWHLVKTGRTPPPLIELAATPDGLLKPLPQQCTAGLLQATAYWRAAWLAGAQRWMKTLQLVAQHPETATTAQHDAMGRLEEGWRAGNETASALWAAGRAGMDLSPEQREKLDQRKVQLEAARGQRRMRNTKGRQPVDGAQRGAEAPTAEAPPAAVGRGSRSISGGGGRSCHRAASAHSCCESAEGARAVQG